MAMSQKHYREFAAMLSALDIPKTNKVKVAKEMVRIFKSENRRFDPQIFYSAAGVEVKVKPAPHGGK